MAKSLLVKEEELITIVLFYKSKANKFGVRQYKIIDEDEAKALIAKGDKDIDSLTTKWVIPTWQSNSYILRSSTFYSPSEGINRLDYNKYQDNLFKTCLKEWDIVDENDKKVTINNESIGNLPSVIATALLELYEKSLTIEDEDQKK
jgi:hypothetical protein